MTKNFIALTAVCISLFLYSCDKSKHAGYDTADSGLAYKFHKEAKGPKAKEGDFVTVKMIYRSETDSVLFDSKTRPEGTLTFPLPKPAFKGALEEGLAMMGPGDSASFKILADSLFIRTFGMKEVPKEIKKGSYITFDIKMEKVQKEEEIRKQQTEMMEKKKAEETAAIQDYLKQNNITAQPTASGLIYVEEKKGTGKKAEAGKMVKVHYTGKLLNGQQFDSSVDRKEPFEFPLGQGQVIPGWDEGVSLMSEGGKGKLIIPSSIGYGGQQAGPIPPYSTLVFDVELLKVSDAPTAGPQMGVPSEQPAKK